MWVQRCAGFFSAQLMTRIKWKEAKENMYNYELKYKEKHNTTEQKKCAGGGLVILGHCWSMDDNR